ncbi:related to metaphase-anaphase transition (Mlo2) [Lecanosticta acicola]|uniref:Related to metaphase-anaphase transition (Mlo2) n=1 Tax=Lecanosticta acicola TaxID=111012 RepID=A0AAI8Z8G0_9PEZI|nr:related to metaphase-anaphase transition (Mlo2) [Lecanosticta acicola]
MASTDPPANGLHRVPSMSQTSETSQTAQEYIASQLSLEADAREALPYQFDTCTKPLGPLRQSVYACLTCTPPPASPHQQFTPAGVCYSCSISCHGEHNLVEIFSKRDFVCDCGTTRMQNAGISCNLRLNPKTGRKGDVSGEEARVGNKYSQNFEGKFCGCGEEYDPEMEKGTMFQCLGLGHVEDGGCGEDWWHPECLMGMPRKQPVPKTEQPKEENEGQLETVKEEGEDGVQQPATTTGVSAQPAEDEAPLGFPDEDDFDNLICYQCANAYPWIKQYAGTPGFLPALPSIGSVSQTNGHAETKEATTTEDSKKRRAEDEAEDARESNKKARPDVDTTETTTAATEPHETTSPKHASLPAASSESVSVFVKEDFRDHLCRCPECFPRLARHPQLLEEEDTYEPPVSESGHDENGSVAGRSVHSGSLLDRGEAALSSMDRVRAIEGVMAYNHVRDKVKAFLQPFAESGQPVGAEDIKAYFAKLRGDEQAMREAGVGAESGGAVQGDGRKEQDGH